MVLDSVRDFFQTLAAVAALNGLMGRTAASPASSSEKSIFRIPYNTSDGELPVGIC